MIGGVSPASQPARLVRALSIGVWVTSGSVVAHLLGEGSSPSMVALIPVVIAATVVTWWIGRRQITLPIALGLLAVPQVVVHLLASYVHHHVMVPSAWMLTAHVFSILVTGVAIAHAEHVWWSLREAWDARWRPITVATPLVTATLPTLVGVAAVANPAELRHFVSRRGPPHA